ncbi:endonuclease/exonuclease/phosphatase family protein [Spirosoma luteolum]
MNTPETVLLAYAALITVVSFLNLIRIDYWWIRIWDFPHLQLTVLAFTGLVAWGALGAPTHDWFWLVPVGLLAALTYQGWLIYPFTPLHKPLVARAKPAPTQSEQDPNAPVPIRLLTANVFMDNLESPQVRSLVDAHAPDLVLVLETNKRWQNDLKPIEANYPYRVHCPLENTYGMLFYSRLPILHSELRFLIQDDIPSVYVQLDTGNGQRLHFYGVHPMPPSPTEHYRSTERDAELLLVGREAKQQTEPVIVAGDLNDVAWSHTTRLFQRISGLLDPRVGRGLYNTFNAKYFFLRWPLDHVFVSGHFQLERMRRLPNCGSDHFPMFISLLLNGTPQEPTAEKPAADADDQAEARETIAEATNT